MFIYATLHSEETIVVAPTRGGAAVTARFSF
jgi:hypothetical protein